MPGDAASSNEDELLDQIDELKARMDRLMSGGSSTSNSALLTDKAEARTPPIPSEPEPDQTRVRDLVETDDTEVIEVYPGPKEVVPFPKKEKASAAEDSEMAPAAESDVVAPNPSPGSVISVEEEQREERPQVASFDDLGSAIQHELARDGSIPPAEAKKGPDLASRFGPADEPAAQEAAVMLEDERDLAEPEEEVEPVVEAETADDEEYDDSEDDEDFEDESGDRSAFGKVAAVWALTAVASGAIAVLHFVGII